ncbi:uncharacterized protein A1O5_06640 [Cladophialophora psammophila CBS 110553]|uniref:Aldehyde dehydrogenase domain-containing protein n=1 Tax=Cladophialophora psammophila CBS 110553 TaxID=1182543 RepID=W9WZS2_9EURO|nr:uncharacterized protein A1O5_06640 [Cladophialophora psammophila CBS 110553]EXJ70570.1 hypothetical protein A1O5_06640 [Cladophialophora psammophila CBS 110553]
MDTETVPLLIGNEARRIPGGAKISVHSAAQDRIVGYAEAATVDNAREAVQCAAQAFAKWRNVGISARREILFKAINNFRENQHLLMTSLQSETSCTKEWAAANIRGTLKSLEELACSITSITGEIPSTDDPSRLSLIFQVPVGSVLVIAPWNGGIVLPAKAITQPLAAGCTVVFKASELSPRTHHLVAKMFIDAGLPAGALNVVQTRREDAENVTRAVIAHPAIRKIDFIGSAAVGRTIGEMAAHYLKPVLMELGGKCPAIVLDDADVADAASKCVVGAFLHHGQICFSTERIIVLEAIAEKFTAELRARAQNWQPVDGVSKRIIDNAHSLVEDARAKGCEFVLGEGSPGFVRPSALQPVILTNVTKDMAIYDSESFGPSVSLYVVKTEDEAVELANSSTYGLNAAVHSQNLTRALRVARQIECGTIWVNGLTAGESATCPIGGYKGSGWGRSNQKWGLNEFVQTQTVNLPHL